jgi:hypothetical protein
VRLAGYRTAHGARLVAGASGSKLVVGHAVSDIHCYVRCSYLEFANKVDLAFDLIRPLKKD